MGLKHTESRDDTRRKVWFEFRTSGCNHFDSYERDYISHHNSMGQTRLKVNVNNIIRTCLENIVDLYILIPKYLGKKPEKCFD